MRADRLGCGPAGLTGLALAVLALAACSSQGERFPLNPALVAGNTAAGLRPLSVPPIYGVRPGQPMLVRQPAFVDPSLPPLALGGDDALLAAAGAGEADPAIRAVLEGETGTGTLNSLTVEQLLAAGPTGYGAAIRRRD